jgi:hypothetical protein
MAIYIAYRRTFLQNKYTKYYFAIISNAKAHARQKRKHQVSEGYVFQRGGCEAARWVVKASIDPHDHHCWHPHKQMEHHE